MSQVDDRLLCKKFYDRRALLTAQEQLIRAFSDV